MLIDCKADESSLSSSSSSYGTSRGPLGPFLLAFDPPPLLLGRVEDEDVAVADEAAAALVTVRTKEATAFLATPVTMPSLLTVALVEDPRLIIFGFRPPLMVFHLSPFRVYTLRFSICPLFALPQPPKWL